jgi:hypothetical protein
VRRHLTCVYMPGDRSTGISKRRRCSAVHRNGAALVRSEPPRRAAIGARVCKAGLARTKLRGFERERETGYEAENDEGDDEVEKV